MKKNLLLILLFFVFNNLVCAQTPSWEWAKSAKGSLYDEGNGICTDINGNTYVVGYFASSTVSFGDTVLTNTAGLGYSMFIIKYDAVGNILWTRTIGGGAQYSKGANAICTDAFGNLYITGYYGGLTITFGNITLTNMGYSNMFLVKYDTSGNVIWAKGGGGSLYAYGMAISNDVNGNVLVTGSFSSSSFTIDGITVSNPFYGCGSEIFIAKLDESGNPLWIKEAGGFSADQANGITTDSKGNVYITGYVHSASPIDFDSIVLSNNGSKSIFIAKYNSYGNIVWVKTAGGSVDEGKGICTDVNDNIYITGYYGGLTASFGNTTLTNSGNMDVFVVKYDSLGNVLWARGAGGTGYDEGLGICSGAESDIYITGYNHSPSFSIETDTLIGDGLFVAKYNTSGTELWALQGRGSDLCESHGNSISKGSNNDVYITGFFNSSYIVIGNDTLTNDTASCSLEILVAKISQTNTNVVNLKLSNTNIYPNPSSGKLKVELTKKPSSTTQLTITNLLGEKLQETKLTDQASEITLNYPKGIYFITISNAIERTTQKIILQ